MKLLCLFMCLQIQEIPVLSLQMNSHMNLYAPECRWCPHTRTWTQLCPETWGGWSSSSVLSASSGWRSCPGSECAAAWGYLCTWCGPGGGFWSRASCSLPGTCCWDTGWNKRGNYYCPHSTQICHPHMTDIDKSKSCKKFDLGFICIKSICQASINKSSRLSTLFAKERILLHIIACSIDSYLPASFL